MVIYFLRFISLISLLSTLIFMSGCGGGGGSGESKSNQNVVLEARQTQLYLEYKEDSIPTASEISIKVNSGKEFYVAVAIEGDGLSNQVSIETMGLEVRIIINAKSGLTPARYEGNLIVAACADLDCNKLLGKQLHIPYIVNILPILKVSQNKISMIGPILNNLTSTINVQLPAGETDFTIGSESHLEWINIIRKSSQSFELATAIIPPGFYSDKLVIKSGEETVFIDVEAEVVKNEIDHSQANLNLLEGAYDWFDFQGLADHSGYVPVDLDPSNFTARWRWPVDSTLNDAIEVRILNEKFYFSLNQVVATHLVALNESDGSLDFMKELVRSEGYGYYKVDASHISSNKILVRSRGSGDYQLDNLSIIDIPTTNIEYSKSLRRGSAFYLEDSYLYLWDHLNNGFSKSLYQTNQNVWSVVPQLIGDSSPVILNDYIYFFSRGYLTAYDKNSGNYKGSLEVYPPSYNYQPTPVVLKDNHFLILSGRSEFGVPEVNIAKVNSGELLKDWSIEGAYAGEPVTNGSTFYILNNEPFQLEARRVDDGSLLWVWSPDSKVESYFTGNILLANNVVIFSTDRLTHAVDLNNHRTVWVYPSGTTSISMSKNGLLVLSVAEFAADKKPTSNYIMTLNTQ